MKMYNMRNNEELGPITKNQLRFLKENLLAEGEEDDEDFFISFKMIKELEEKASGDDEIELVKIIKETLSNEKGKVGLDIYYE